MISQEYLEVMTDQGWNGPGAPATPVADPKLDLSYESSSSGSGSPHKDPLPLPELSDEVAFGNLTQKELLQGPETRLQWTKRVLTEGHTFPDALMTVAAAQIGQVLLTMPNALYQTGLTAGLLSTGLSQLLSVWTMYVLVVLALERKRDLIKKNEWYAADGQRKRITQYHEVVGHHMGPIMKYAAQFVLCLSLGGTALAQIIACSSDIYVIHKGYSKRTWSLIWGGVLMIFAFVPTFRHFRVLNVIALVGTSYTALYILITAIIHGRSPQAHPGSKPVNVQGYFTGGAVLINALGGHSIALEMMDSMRNQKKYMGAFGFGFAWSFLLSIPHSIATNIAYPTGVAKNSNILGVLPVNNALRAAAYLMTIHQFVAFALYGVPLFIYFEKAFRVHEKSFIWRVPARLPIALFIYLLGVMLPFYGAINSFMGAFGAPLIAFVFPAFTFNVVYWKKEKRRNSPYPPIWPFKLWDWRFAFTLNWIIIGCFLAFWGAAVVFSMKAIVDNANTFGLFAECYQCPANYKSLLHH